MKNLNWLMVLFLYINYVNGGYKSAIISSFGGVFIAMALFVLIIGRRK